MALLKSIFSSSNLIFILALVCGIIWPKGFPIGNALIFPALIIIITISLLRFPRGFFRKPGPLLYASVQGNVMNYLVLGNFIVLSSVFLIQKQELWIGMILIAAVPPPVAIISLGHLMHTDENSVFTNLAGAYLGALLFVPLMGLAFLKYIIPNYWNIMLIVLGLILLPLILSRLAVEKSWDKALEPYEDICMHYCSFIVFYTITAGSRSILMKWTTDLYIIAAIAFICAFLFPFVIRQIGLYFHSSENKINSFLLMGTMKDYGIAGGIALILFSQEVALPSLIFAIFSFIYINWFKYRMRHLADRPIVQENNSK